MIKRCLAFLLLAVCFLLMLPLTAYADVLIEPNNDFYTRHRSECVSLNRSFYANGEGGSVSVKQEPGSNTETAVIENSEILNILFTYNDNGEIWGVTEIFSENEPYDTWPNGWIPMSQLLLVYDYASFAEEYQEEFYTFSGSYEALKTANEIVLWSWPGSGELKGTLEALTVENDGEFNISKAYKDKQGQEWGFLVYWRGERNVWICLSNPASRDIPAFNPPPQPKLWQSDDVNPPKNGLSLPVIIIILVFVLVAGTAVLVRVFWKPNNGKT